MNKLLNIFKKAESYHDLILALFFFMAVMMMIIHCQQLWWISLSRLIYRQRCFY
ncbi:translocator EscV [Escherichia coli]|uniref:Translocator EscV n=1 Tax=Escherichia coli TaxID=562 RepID=A0A376UGM2_ECOLX|nr:translocator EscV [Escherichia coli]